MIPLTLLPNDAGSRITRDRLELLTALMTAPGFDVLYRADVIDIPGAHPVYGWHCAIKGCERAKANNAYRLCQSHDRQWKHDRPDGISRAEFERTAEPLRGRGGGVIDHCRICPDRTTYSLDSELCARHHDRWGKYTRAGGAVADYEQWVAGQPVFPGYGICMISICPNLAESPLGLCRPHQDRYKLDGVPGRASLPRKMSRSLRRVGQGFIESTGRWLFWSGLVGLLIHAAVGRAAGLGCWRTNRSGLRV